MTDDEGVLRRWHRRKTAAREEDSLKLETETESKIEAGEGVREAALTVPEDIAGEPDGVADGEAEPLDLPDIDTLDAESDFTAFLGEGVPEEIQRLALRKLWRLDPVFANLDGLVDYGEDFTDASMVIEGMKTVYRVGKGLLTDEEIAEAEAESEYGAAVEAETDADAEMETEAVEASPETEPDEPDGDAAEITREPDPVLSDAGDTELSPAEAERSNPTEAERSDPTEAERSDAEAKRSDAEAERSDNESARADTRLSAAMDDVTKKT